MSKNQQKILTGIRCSTFQNTNTTKARITFESWLFCWSNYVGDPFSLCRPVVPGCAMAHPDFGRSVNPFSTRGDRLCPPNYYWHTRIFRSSDGPEYCCVNKSVKFFQKNWRWKKMVACAFWKLLTFNR